MVADFGITEQDTKSCTLAYFQFRYFGSSRRRPCLAKFAVSLHAFLEDRFCKHDTWSLPGQSTYGESRKL